MFCRVPIQSASTPNHVQEQDSDAHGTTILARRLAGARDSGARRDRRRLLRQRAMGGAIGPFSSVCKSFSDDVFLRNGPSRLPFQQICKPGFTRRGRFARYDHPASGWAGQPHVSSLGASPHRGFLLNRNFPSLLLS